MNEELNHIQHHTGDDAPTDAATQSMRETFANSRELFRAGRRPDEFQGEDIPSSVVSALIRYYIHQHERLRLVDEILEADGRAEATIWVDRLDSLEDLDSLMDALVMGLQYPATIQFREHKDAVAVLEVVSIEDDVYIDCRITYTGPHVHSIVALGRTWVSMMEDTFEA